MLPMKDGKFPIIVTCTTMIMCTLCNFRNYLLDATSAEERDSWVEAITKAIPEAKKEADKK